MVTLNESMALPNWKKKHTRKKGDHTLTDFRVVTEGGSAVADASWQVTDGG